MCGRRLIDKSFLTLMQHWSGASCVRPVDAARMAAGPNALSIVRLGLIASLARPGGNLTGINFFNGELIAKRLELLRELVPTAIRVAVLVNPADATNSESALREVNVAARAMGLQIQVLNARTSGDINAAFATFVRERPDALFVGGDAFFNSRRVQLANLASRHAIPRSIPRARFCRSRRADELRK